MVNNLGSNGSTTATITNNDLENNNQEGVGIYSATNASTLTALVSNNFIAFNGQRIPHIVGVFDASQYAGIGSGNNASTLNLTIDHNMIVNNLGAGIEATTSDFAGNSLTHLTVTNNAIDANGAGLLALNPASDDADGLMYVVSGSAAGHTGSLFANVHGNDFTGNALHGILAATLFNSFSSMCTSVTGNSGPDGYRLRSTGPVTFNNAPTITSNGGTLSLEPPSANSGTFSLTGVTSVPTGTCGF